jgi:membrane protein DedA with SNARE-associated domain|tara:strand:+ start:41707 stop:42285 length:579 start_codon:yes stop_codon:yes gene_type:complete
LEKKHNKIKFLAKNLARGFFWLAIMLGAYFFVQKHFGFDLKELLGPFYENTAAIYLIFLISETVFGIIPPEFFMFWAVRPGIMELYAQHVAALMLVSYCAGIVGFFIGSKFGGTRFYRYLRRTYLGKVESYFNEYGGFLIVVAAVTPIPFSGVCILIGAVNYNFKKFLWISLTRFLRFIVYAAIIWEANSLS